MPTAGMNRYMIAPRDAANSQHVQMLEEVARHVQDSPPASAVVARKSGNRLTIDATPQVVDDLRARYGNGLIIEADSPLQY